MIFTDLDTPQLLPTYLRVFQGVVEVFFGEVTETGFSYFADENGLEAFLEVFFDPVVGACCSDEECTEATECDCVELTVGDYQGDGTGCEDLECPVAPAVSVGGLVAMAILMLGMGLFLLIRQRRFGFR